MKTVICILKFTPRIPILLSGVILLYCSSCNNEANNVAGGLCTYQYDTIPAQIISIDTVDSSNRNLLLVLAKSGVYKHDTIDLHADFHHYTTREQLQQKNIGLNDSLIFITGKLISGSCNPSAGTTLQLDHYKK